MIILVCRVNTDVILNKNVSQVHGCPIRTIIFYVQSTVKIGDKIINLALQLERLYYREHFKFQVDRTSTSSKTTSTKIYNQNCKLKRDRRTDEQTDRRTNGRTDQKT